MGWTYQMAKYYKKGKIDRKAECDAMFTQEEHDAPSIWKEGETIHYPQMRVLKSAMVGKVYYGAIESIKNGVREVWAAVVITSTENNNDFGYKDMDESCHPYYYDCPKSIFELLTPTTNESALAWRRGVLENYEKKKSSTSLSKLPIGTQIKVKMPFDTQRYKKDDVVILTKQQRGYRSTYWTTGYCYFTRGLMKTLENNCEIEVLQRGE